MKFISVNGRVFPPSQIGSENSHSWNFEISSHQLVHAPKLTPLGSLNLKGVHKQISPLIEEQAKPSTLTQVWLKEQTYSL